MDFPFTCVLLSDPESNKNGFSVSIHLAAGIAGYCSKYIVLHSNFDCLIIHVGKLLSYIIYQVKFHPLAKYPGPFLAKLTNAYAGYHAAKQDIHIDMWRCHQKYGQYSGVRENIQILSPL